MNRLTTQLAVSFVFAIVSVSCLSADSGGFPGMPESIARQLREIGAVIDGPNTSAIYAPFFNPDDFSDKAVSRDIAYGRHERHVLDIFAAKPAGSGKPVLVFVHGGGFSRGAKTLPNSPFYDNVMNWAVDEGMVGVNINYRLAPEFQWPSGVEDLTRVVEWLQNNISNYGGNPQQVFLWGHSAGAAHVADYLAWQANNNLDDEVAGAILTSGFYELESDEERASIWSSYYGEDVSSYEERSSLPGLLLTDTPILVNDAELDTEFALSAAKRIVDAFNAAGKPLTYVHLKGHSHISETFAVGTEDQSLSGPVKQFIQNIIDN